MEVNDEMIDKLAKLARLHFDEDEKKEIGSDLRRMIAFVEKLNEVNLDGVSPMLHVNQEINILRDDEVTGSVTREEALRDAPVHDGKFFKAPKAIKNPNN